MRKKPSQVCYLMPFTTGYSVPQTEQPRSPRETLPTMYDLPSEFPEEPGLPDEFHDLQPQLLSRTLRLQDYAADNRFTGSDLNLYYDVHHPLWHKRPDWFLALDVPRLYDGHDLRRSYVVWQEGQAPTIVVGFLSPRTEQEDLGRFFKDSDQIPDDDNKIPESRVGNAHPPANGAERPPSKVDVYEKYLRVPHYLVYSRYTQRLRYFKLVGRRYEEQSIQDGTPMIWLDDLKIGLGLWKGYFEGLPGPWLRWCDVDGNWLLTDTEQAEKRAEQLAERLRAMGVDPDTV
ncbi:Uma2 family endonuclease [Adonisia turfae]|nr:Uma2 family endonuclease [Adonisia turfae]